MLPACGLNLKIIGILCFIFRVFLRHIYEWGRLDVDPCFTRRWKKITIIYVEYKKTVEQKFD